MDIKVGAKVMGAQGQLGEVSRVIYDEHTHTMDELVVKHGFLFHGERVVPLRHVMRAEGDVVYLDLDEQGFEAMDVYAPYPDRPEAAGAGMPTYNEQTVQAATLTMGTGSTLYPRTAQPSEGREVPDDQQLPTIARGMPIFDVNGQKVGEVGDFSIDAQTEMLTRLTLRNGVIFRTTLDLPVDWVQEIAVKGIMLRVPKEQLQTLTSNV